MELKFKYLKIKIFRQEKKKDKDNKHWKRNLYKLVYNTKYEADLPYLSPNHPAILIRVIYLAILSKTCEEATANTFKNHSINIDNNH